MGLLWEEYFRMLSMASYFYGAGRAGYGALYGALY